MRFVSFWLYHVENYPDFINFSENKLMSSLLKLFLLLFYILAVYELFSDTYKEELLS